MNQGTIIAAIVALIAVGGMLILSIHGPNEVIIPGQLNVTYRIDNQTWTLGSPVNWGNITAAGNYTKIVVVSNYSNRTILLSFNTTVLPYNWTETFSLANQTVAGNSTSEGVLTLNAATLPNPTDYPINLHWEMWITAEAQ